MSTSCRKSSMIKWRTCIFLLSSQSSVFCLFVFPPQERVQRRTVEQVVNVSVEIRHSSGVSETHLTPLPSKCHEACTANPRPFLAATGARDSESTENLGSPLVQYIDLIVDVTVCFNTKYEPSRQYRRRKKLLRMTSAGQCVLFHWQWR